MSFNVQRIKVHMDSTLILEADQGTFEHNTLSIAHPKWARGHNGYNLVKAGVRVEVDGHAQAFVPATPPGAAPGQAAAIAPTFPRHMKLHSALSGGGVSLIDR
jgi:hypothetical protein